MRVCVCLPYGGVCVRVCVCVCSVCDYLIVRVCVCEFGDAQVGMFDGVLL